MHLLDLQSIATICVQYLKAGEGGKQGFNRFFFVVVVLRYCQIRDVTIDA